MAISSDQILIKQNDEVATSACLLDPRFKGNMFISTVNRIAAVEKLRTELSKINIESEPKENNRPVLVENGNSTQSSKRRRLDFWGTVAEQCETQTVNNYSTELDSYLNENCLKNDKDVIMWWEENKNKFPLLFQLSLKYLCIPATSCASERVFSKAGEIVSAKRSRIKPNHVNNLIFLNKNYAKLI